MSINLEKGSKIDLTKTGNNVKSNLSKMVIGLGWDVNARAGSDYDLDACALLLQDGKLVSDSDIVSYRSKTHTSGKVWSTGDNLTGDGDGDDEQIIAMLDSIPAKYTSIVFYASIYQGKSRRQVFSNVENAFIRAVDANGVELGKYILSNDPGATDKCSVVFAEVVRNGEGWDFKAIGDAYATDNLSDIANMYKKSGAINFAKPSINNSSTIESTQVTELEVKPRKKLFGLF